MYIQQLSKTPHAPHLEELGRLPLRTECEVMADDVEAWIAWILCGGCR